VAHIDQVERKAQVHSVALNVFRVMDRVYLLAGYAAAFCMTMIFVLTMVQVMGRMVGFNPPGLTDYAGYLTAASTFLALAYAFNQGAQIRVSLFLSMMGKARYGVELIAFAISGSIGLWFAYYSWSMVIWSYKLGDMSSGLDATHLWIPQTSMAVGVSLLAVAVIDHALRMIITGDHGIVAADEPL
jgi:TRAP-type C4-dicarboxylate transport system permease small subunit